MIIDKKNFKKVTRALREISLEASSKVLEIYQTEFDFITKQDNSPLTKADLESNRIICSFLKKEFPKICIISEENIKNNIKKNTDFFLIDPLDGTKEFLNRNGEFTINICFLKNYIPQISVITIPVTKTQYFTDNEFSFKFEKNKINKISSEHESRQTRILTSRSHLDSKTLNFINHYPNSEVLKVGSSLKFCLISEGKADLYIRYGRTMEWDIAAGYAILNKAHGKTLDFNFKSIKYGKKDFLNNSFISFKKNFDQDSLKPYLV